MLGIRRPTMSSPGLVEFSSGGRVGKLNLGTVMSDSILLPIRIEGNVDMIPVVDAHSSGIPVWFHTLGLDVKVTVHCLGRNVELNRFSSLQPILHFLRQRKGLGSILHKLGQSRTGRWIVEVGMMARLAMDRRLFRTRILLNRKRLIFEA